MKTLFFAIIFLFNIGISCADMIAMSEEEIQLQQKFTTAPTHEEVVSAFESRHHLLHLEAIKWLILNRDIKTWNSLKDQKGKLKETSLLMSPILDHLVEQPIEANQPLILALKAEHLKMLVKKDEEVPLRYEDGDPPVDEVLYELLAKDLKHIRASSAQSIEATRLLNLYRAPLKKPEAPMELKNMSNKVKPDVHDSVSHATEGKIDENKEITNTTQTNRSFNSVAYGATIVVFISCSWLVWRIMRKTQRLK